MLITMTKQVVVARPSNHKMCYSQTPKKNCFHNFQVVVVVVCGWGVGGGVEWVVVES